MGRPVTSIPSECRRSVDKLDQQGPQQVLKSAVSISQHVCLFRLAETHLVSDPLLLDMESNGLPALLKRPAFISIMVVSAGLVLVDMWSIKAVFTREMHLKKLLDLG